MAQAAVVAVGVAAASLSLPTAAMADVYCGAVCTDMELGWNNKSQVDNNYNGGNGSTSWVWVYSESAAWVQYYLQDDGQRYELKSTNHTANHQVLYRNVTAFRTCIHLGTTVYSCTNWHHPAY
ncbi:hypothetical protein ACWCPF_27150 [Streptomyces sp. NPDC001858]